MLSSTLWFHVGGVSCECPPAYQYVLLNRWPCVLRCRRGNPPGSGEGTRFCYLHTIVHGAERLAVDLGTHIPRYWTPRCHLHHPIPLRLILLAHLGGGSRPLCELLQLYPIQISLSRLSRETTPRASAVFIMSVHRLSYLPLSDGFTPIMVIVNRLSKSCCFIPLSGLPTSLQVAEAIFQQVVRHYGLLEEIVIPPWSPI